MRPISATNGSHYAITDLYDEKRRTFLVQYPTWFIIVLALAGVAAFAITGFLGYGGAGSATNALDPTFRQPWLLFLWFCAVLITLQASILRNQTLRRRLIMMLAVTAVAIIFIGITYFNSSLPEILQRLLQGGRLLRFLASHSVTYAVVNFGLIAIFWADTVRRWLRRARGLPPNPRVDLGIESARRPDELPTLSELISGDLIAGAFFVLLLAFVFQAQVVGALIHPHGVAPVTTCTVSWPFGHCTPPGGLVSDAPTLSFIDLIQALVYLPLGLIILALTTTLSGLGAVGGVDDKRLEAELPAEASAAQSSTVPIAVDVTQTLINTLRSALDRRLRLLLNNLTLSLRTVGWPALIFVATYGLAELATNIQDYLHSERTLTALLDYVLPSLGWGLLALLTAVCSVALMLFKWRVADNSFRFLGLVGFILLLTFWLFSLALWGFNQLLLQTHALIRHPFDPPSSPTYFSAAALLIFGSLLLLRRMRGPQPQPSGVRREPVGVVVVSPPGADPGATQASGQTLEH